MGRRARLAGAYSRLAIPLLLFTLMIRDAGAEILTPPYFNLADGKDITASATCGVGTSGPELYCQLVGANSDHEANLNQNIIQGQQCDYCDPEDEEKKHPPEYAVDGTETWWQSPPLSRGKKYEEVNLTINLEQEFHVAYVYVQMGNSPRPRLWVLEKSADYGKSWSPWQYFADSDNDCITYFGISSNTPITRDDSVICTTVYSKIVPLEKGEIPISILNNRPSAKHYFNSTILQEWTRATNVRLRFLKTNNLLGHLMSVRRQDPTVTRRYFYSIKEISIGGRCMCNGHADTCDSLDPNHPKKLFCRCQHNTCGPQCNTCCRGFEQKKWRQSTYSKKFVCEPCNCFGHSDECAYNATIDEKHLSLDIHGNYEGGGECQNCRHNTEGINCNRCKPRFYRPSNKPLNATDVCQPCNCDYFYSTGNCFDSTGQCECRPEYAAPNCDSCSYGYFGFPDCRPCECFLNGTDGYHCEATEGQCPCKENYAGHYCNLCAEEYYGFPDCFACDCNPIGSLNNLCDVSSGNCTCKNNYGGRSCDICEDGYYDYPSCTYCECDTRGTESGICDKQDGHCLCKEGYGGPHCDQCISGYYGYPNCEPCNCSKNGTSSYSCDANGKCSCLSNFVGKTCNQCAPGYYKYPECTSCNCDSHGSIGVSCDLEGKCQCRENFDGDRCEQCKANFYNFPTCEGCNCDPAGIAGTFQGCGSLPTGELCQCKERVEGRICNQCKKLYWNLQPYNPDGCEDCHCNIPGVIGSIGECNGKTGQCICKPSVTGRDCSICVDGSFDLQESNIFGCSVCACDIGGSLSTACNKITGQCHCRSRIEGQTCNQPMRTQYFPTLHQFQYEAEEGRTPSNRSVRYKFDEDLFPNYSWRGYAVFSPLQNKIIHEIEIQKSSLYRMVMRYVNPNNEPIVGSVTITPDSHTEVEQHFKVQFKPKTTKPSFVTVAGALGNLPSVMVMNPGHWMVTIAIEKSLFLDYFVLLPAEYYEASILTQEVNIPCEIGYKGLCRHFAYPNLSPYDSVLGTGGYRGENDERNPLTEYLTDQEMLAEINESKLPLINDVQKKIHFELTITKPGPHVLIITYVSPPKDESRTATIFVEANNMDKGKATVYTCKFTSICRQVVTETNGKVAIMNFPNNYVTVVLDGEPGSNVAIKSVVAIPAQDWSVDYLKPKSVCVRKNGKCIQGIFPEAPDAKKIELEQSNQVMEGPITPDGVFDNSSKFIYLHDKDAMIDVPAKVPHPGDYVFVVQYYQPDYPEFNVDVLVQNGKFYEAEVPMTHCPSNSGCRSLVRQLDGNTRFQLIENFYITLKDATGRGIWLDYILVIPADLYSDDYLKKLQFDQTKEFIKKCGNNHFHINTSEEGFCRDSVFSLTTNFNNGALPCLCDIEGTMSFECEKFGGQCPCKSNIIGRRCNICKTGFYGFPNCRPCNCPSTATCEPETGACVCPDHVTGELCDQCEVGTYGYDPIIGCEECQCSPNGVLNGDLQCDLLTGKCKCKKNVVGRQCSKCRAGHYQYPYCEKCDCDIRGTTEDICDQETADCHCKENVQGSACDLCKEGTFNLQPSNEKGCSQCFCFGKTTRCNSASLYKTYMMDMAGWDVVFVNEKNETVEILKHKPQELNETHIVVDMGSGIDKTNLAYLSAPAAYLNKKLTSYGGWLNFTVFYTNGVFGKAVPGADVILQGADSFLVYRGEEQPPSSTNFRASVQLVESNFETKQNLRATREQIMVVLGDLRGIYIRGTYWQPSLEIALSHVTLDTATEAYMYNAELASSVEQCLCPPNYQGLSCEECAEGYYRAPGPHGGNCVKCQCNGHADSCDVNTGICRNCKDGTTGDHCEICQVGYYGNATVGTPTDCLICACPLPVPTNNFASGCEVSEDGSLISCDCQPGYYGARCEACSAGFFGRPDMVGDFCKPCECSGNIDTNEIGSCDSVNGECLHCLNNTYGEACNLCAPGFFGDAVDKKDCRSCYCDQCGMKHCDSYNGLCECHENVVGEKCDRCADNHYGFSTCQGCQPCNCAVASESSQCADEGGKCKCKPGVEGRTCDQCMAGFWNYGPEGCTSCGCTTGYSRGASCNPITGQCECLPGVLGEKCDHCPIRTVLDERRGCQQCDKCTHDLLDVTDELEQILDPVGNSFKNVADSYFTNQRLDFINETLTKLLPEVRLLDPSRIDFEPLKQEIQRLSTKAYGLKRRVDFQEDDGTKWKGRAEKNLKDMNDLEQAVSREINLLNTIINEVQSLASNTELGTGPKIDNALREAQEILNRIKLVSFIDDRDKATDQANQANILVSEMLSFEEPVKELVNNTDDVSEKVRMLTKQIDDMYNLTLQADDRANEAERLNFENKKLVDAGGPGSLKNATDQTNNDLAKADDLNTKARALFDEAEYNFSDLKINVTPGNPTEANTKLKEAIDTNEGLLESVKDIVPQAIAHAQILNQESMGLEALLSNTRNLTGVRAASVYQDIANDINTAKKYAQDASKSANNASDLVDGLTDRSSSIENRSRVLLEQAVGAVRKTDQELKPILENARRYDMPDISDLNDKNNINLDLIEKSLGTLSVQASSMVVQEALNNADKADYVIGEVINNNINGNVDRIPADLKQTKQLSKDMSDSIHEVSQARRQLDSINTVLPDINGRLRALDERQQAINTTGNSLYDKIEALKQKINNVRDLANRIRIGLTFFPNTTLELKNPESLPLQTTSTKISVFVRTDKPNGFLLYLGNENRTNIPRVKTHDFMALTLENGYPVLTLDLGSGPHRVIGNRVISDNVWRQLIVDRTGRNIKFIIREDVGEGKDQLFETEESLTGSHSIFNLDQEKSKLFVGGYPPSFQIQDAVITSSFDGQMEELMIGDVPVSFWNFVDAENNWLPAYERDKLVNLQPPTGYRFDRDGYAILSKKGSSMPPDTKKFRIQFRFKTWASNGLMYLMGGRKNFLSLELKDGRLLYQFDLGDGPIEIITSPTSRYNDGNWHTVEARRFERIGVLTVDGENIDQMESQGQEKSLESTDFVYFGGYPRSMQHNYKPVTQIGFEGCIDEVVFQETSVDLTKNIQAFGVMTGCPAKFASLVSFDSVHPGYVKWDRVMVPRSLQINLKFRTQLENGLIYHLVDTDGTPASTLSLSNGQLVLESQGSRLETDIQDIKFNDNEWHVITATHNETSLRLDIDDSEEESTDRAGYPRQINDGALYVGNVPDDVRNGLNVPPFVGCIGDTTVNGIIVNFANTTERPNAHLSQCNTPESVGVPEEEPALVTYPPPPPLDEDATTDLVDISRGGDEYQPPGSIEGRRPENEETTTAPVSVIQTTPFTITTTMTTWPTSPKEPATVDGCRLPHYPAPDPDQFSENAWRFGTAENSRFEYSTLNGRYKDNYDFQIDIKTLSHEGIVFYSSDLDRRDFIALYVKNGLIHYTYNCGSGPALLIGEKKINDHQWHTIIFKRTGVEGELIIDDQPPIYGSSEGTTTGISVQPPFFVGGVDPSISHIAFETIGVNNTFSGCIRNFMLNGQHVGEAARKIGTIPCSKRVEPGMFFYPGNGSNWFRAEDKYTVGRQMDIQMDIKPRSSSGLLFSIHGKNDHVVLEMINGTIKFLVKASKAQLETSYTPPSPNSLCDGNWHNIRAVKQKNAVVLSVDHQTATPGIAINPGGVFSKHSIYIGGHPHLESGKALRGSVSRAQYVGCINNIIIKERPYAIDPSRIHGDVTAGVCPTI